MAEAVARVNQQTVALLSANATLVGALIIDFAADIGNGVALALVGDASDLIAAEVVEVADESLNCVAVIIIRNAAIGFALGRREVKIVHLVAVVVVADVPLRLTVVVELDLVAVVVELDAALRLAVLRRDERNYVPRVNVVSL